MSETSVENTSLCFQQGYLGLNHVGFLFVPDHEAAKVLPPVRPQY